MLNVVGGRTNDGWQYEGAEEDKNQKKKTSTRRGKGGSQATNATGEGAKLLYDKLTEVNFK